MRSFLAMLLVILALPVTASAQTLDKIKETGQLVIGFRTDAAPLSYLADNQPQGYTPRVCLALVPEIATAVGLEELEVIFEPVTTETRFEKVESGEIDLLCGAATITLSRREIVDFSIPVYVDGATVALKKDGPESLEGLAGMKIGVRSGTTTLEALENSLQALNIDAEIIQFDDHPSGMAALHGDVVAAYFADQSILMYMVLTDENNADLKVLDQILTVEKQGLALRRGDDDFRLTVDRGLSRLYGQGIIQEIFKQSLQGVQPGFALEAMFVLSPTIP